MGNSLPTEESGAPRVPEQSGTQIVPEESGAPSVPEQSGTQMVPEQSGAPSVPEQSGTQMVPEESGGTTDVPTMQEMGTDSVPETAGVALGQERSEQERSENEADSVLGTSPSYADHVQGPGTPATPPPSMPSPGPERFSPSPVAEGRPEGEIAAASAQAEQAEDEAWGQWQAAPDTSSAAQPQDAPSASASGSQPVGVEDRELKRPRKGIPSGSRVQLSAVPLPGEAEESLLRQVFMREQERRIQEAASLGVHLRAEPGEPLPLLSHVHGRPSIEGMYDSLSYAMTDRGFLTRVSLGAGPRYVPGGSSGITGQGRLDRPEEFLEETPYMPPRLPSYPEPEQPRQQKLMIDAATITENALEEWSAWLLAARQGRSLREWGILASDIKVAIQYLSESPPEGAASTRGGRWSNTGRAGRKKQQEYPTAVGVLAYLQKALKCVDCFDKAPTGYNSLLLGPAALCLERPQSASAADEGEAWKYLAASVAVRVQRLLDKKRVKNRVVTEMTAVYLQTAKSAPRPRPIVRSPTTPAESGDSSSDSSEISGVSGESLLEGDGVAEAIGSIRSCQDKGESLWTPGVVCRLFGTPELPHKVFPEAAKAMAEQGKAIDPGAAAASTAAVVPPTPGTEPKSPHSLPSVIFRPGRLIEKTLMIKAADGSSVPAPPSIPPRHPLPQPPPAPSSQSSPVPNLGQTRAEREFVLPKPPPVGASSSEAQFEDYESVVEAARAAIESASQQL